MSQPIVLAAGGTGGHVFPAEALAAELLARGLEPVLITDRRGRGFGGALDGVVVHRIRAGGIAGVGMITRIGSALAIGVGLVEARAALKRLAPRLVVGFGGYAQLPTLAAACWLGLPTALHEQNAILGRANRLLAGRVGLIATAFAHTQRVPAATRVVHVGMPVRPPFLAARARPYRPPAATGTEPIHLLVLGGSQGAKVFSEVVPAALARLPEGLRRRLRLSQQCRPELLAATEAALAPLDLSVELKPFFDDVPERLAGAHLVIARAGASTLAELTAVGRPSVLVPYPFAIDDHQSANAAALAAAGGAVVVPQPSFEGEGLASRLAALLADPPALGAMARAAADAGVPDAARRLADAVLALIPNHQPAAAGGARRAA